MKKNVIWMLIAFLAASLFVPVISWAKDTSIPQERLLADRGFVEALWLWEVTKVLNLNEEKLVKLLPKFKDLNVLKKETFKKKRALTLRLKKAIKDSQDQVIENILNALDNLEREYISKKKAIENEIKSELTLKEWAKFVLLQEDFEKKLRIILQNLRKIKGEMPRNPLPKKK